jgi:3',5'-cyclic AMP phosphodiesterase CpdA
METTSRNISKQHRRRTALFSSRSAAPAHTDHDDLEVKGSQLTPQHQPSTTGATRPLLRGLATVALALVVLAAGILVVRPDARQYLSFQLGDQIGAPAEAEALAPFPPDDAPLVRLAVAGDVGTGGDEERRTADAMDALEDERRYEALLLLGDNVYPDGDPDQLDRAVFEPFAGVLDDDTQLLAVLGNHDVEDGRGDAHAAAIGMPARWYATEIGDVLVIALDSTRPDDPDQLTWLEQTLAASNATWTIATMHHPPYSGGYHGSSVGVRDAFAPLFETYGVQLVLAGHDHDYQRSQPIDGVTYVVSGGAAKTRPTSRAGFTETAWSTFHFVDLAVWSDRLELRAVDQQGQVFDSASLTP